jgi:hypothetical protein
MQRGVESSILVGDGPASGEPLTDGTKGWSSTQAEIQKFEFRRDDDQSPVAISTSFAMVFMLRAVPAFPAGMRRRESAIPSP